MTAQAINRFVNSRAMVAIVGTMMLVAARYAFQSGNVAYLTGDRGLLFESANLWIADRWLTMTLSTAVILGVGMAWMLMMQVFNPFRAMTTLGASFFMAMMAAIPDLLDQVSSGTLLVAAMPVCVTLLWTSFANPGRMRHVFLLFAVLSALTMTQYCFVIYIPVFIIGCVQMKIFSLRTVLATLLGLITPWWMVLGTGIVDIDAVHAPDFSALFTAVDITEALHIVVVVLITVTLAVAAWFANVMKVISFNVNLRAYNGSLTLITLATILAIFIDFTNALSYLPTLYLMTAYQLSHIFGSNRATRGFIPVLIIIVLYFGLYLWALTQ